MTHRIVKTVQETQDWYSLILECGGKIPLSKEEYKRISGVLITLDGFKIPLQFLKPFFKEWKDDRP